LGLEELHQRPLELAVPQALGDGDLFARELININVIYEGGDVHWLATLHGVPFRRATSCLLLVTNPIQQSEVGERGLDGCEGPRTSSGSWLPDQGARRSRRRSIRGGSAVVGPERAVPATPRVVATLLHVPRLGRKLPRGWSAAALPRRDRSRGGTGWCCS